MNEAYKRYIKTEKGKAALERYEHSEKRRIGLRKIRKRNHEIHRDEDLARNKAHYQKNKDYFRQKNKEHYKKNGEKWKARRAEITKEWVYNKCSPSFVEGCFASVNASLKTTEDITFAQCCALIKAFGYDLKDITYPPFLNRKQYFDKKRTP